MEKYSKVVREMYSQFKEVERHPMEKYSKAVREMYSQFKEVERHPMEKYIGRLVNYYGEIMEVVGYSLDELAGMDLLIVDRSQRGGWSELGPADFVFKNCESYYYVSIDDLID